MKSLALAADLPLPLDVVRQRLAFLGRTGSGKTYAAMKLVELMLQASIQVIVLDTVGVWPGLRTGPKPFSIPVFGGTHGDMQLLPTHGALMGNWLASKRSSAILDVSHFVADEVARFGADFAEAFFLAAKHNPHPAHIVLEECQDFVPENAYGKISELCCKRWERVQKQGRNFLIGVSLISQRPQDVAKTVLNQTECLFAFQMTGHSERRAISKWVSQDVDKRLPALDVGHCFVWSPQWLKIEKWIHIAQKQTPELSQLKRSSGKARALSEIDLSKLRSQLDTVVEETKLIDPVQLREALNAATQRIATLEADAAHRASKVPEAPTKAPTLKAEDRKTLESVAKRVETAAALVDASKEDLRQYNTELSERIDSLIGRGEELQKLAEKLRVLLRPASEIQTQTVQSYPPPKRTQPLTVPGAWTLAPEHVPEGVERVSGAKRKLLIALAQFPDGLTRKRLAAISGFAVSAGYFKNTLSSIRASGYAEGSDQIRITPAGKQTLGSWEALPTGAPLRKYWCDSLGVGSAPARLLHATFVVYPRSLTRAELAVAAGFASPDEGYFKNSLSKIRALGLVTHGKEIRASAELFD